MRINHNISSMTAQGSLFRANRDMSSSIQKLSTGLRINSAADDAAGLGVSENLRTQVRGMSQAMRNTQDAIALLNIADGALNEQTAILQRMRELVIQAKNDTYTQRERDYMGLEFGALMEELDRIAAATTYNGMQLFATPQLSGNTPAMGRSVYSNIDPTSNPTTAHKTVTQSTALGDVSALGDGDNGSGHHFNMMIGGNYSEIDKAAYSEGSRHYSKSSENMLTIAFAQMDTDALFHLNPWNAVSTWGTRGGDLFGDFGWDPGGADMGLNWVFGGNGTINDKLNLIHQIIDGGSDVPEDIRNNLFGGGTGPTGIERVNRMRSLIGAMTNRLEHTLNNLTNQVNNTQSAESIIRDADFATETARFSQRQILTQSATAMLAQANIVPQGVLSLLR